MILPSLVFPAFLYRLKTWGKNEANISCNGSKTVWQSIDFAECVGSKVAERIFKLKLIHQLTLCKNFAACFGSQGFSLRILLLG